MVDDDRKPMAPVEAATEILGQSPKEFGELTMEAAFVGHCILVGAMVLRQTIFEVSNAWWNLRPVTEKKDE